VFGRFKQVLCDIRKGALTALTVKKSILSRQLISDDKQIGLLCDQFQFIDEDFENWNKTYLDRETGIKWTLYYVDGSLHGGGCPILGRQPLPDTNRLIEIALSSGSEDEVFAACRTLTDNEETQKKEFRAELIERLEKIADKRRQAEVVKLTNLNSPLNMRDDLGKTIDQVNSNANHFRSIADRADNLTQE
jgi:hypothetical protein